MSTSKCAIFYSIRTVVCSIVLGCCFLNFSTSFAEQNAPKPSSLAHHLKRNVSSNQERAQYSCLMVFSEGPQENKTVPRKIAIPDFVPLPYSSTIEDTVSSSIFYLKEGSANFEEKIKPFSFHVKSLYVYSGRKLNLGEGFLKNWFDDVNKHQYDSYLITVLLGKTISGTLRIAAPDKKRKGLLPLENSLGIKLNDNPDRYEMGLLTVNRGPSIEKKYRVHLEIWLNLVKFFKDMGQKTVKVYAFADAFGTRLYTRWGFTLVKSYIKNGKVVSLKKNITEYKEGLQLNGGVQMALLEYDFSRENLAELLKLITGGRFDLNSDIVINRLQALQLYDVFEQEQPANITIENNSEEGSLLGNSVNI